LLSDQITGDRRVVRGKRPHVLPQDRHGQQQQQPAVDQGDIPDRQEDKDQAEVHGLVDGPVYPVQPGQVFPPIEYPGKKQMKRGEGQVEDAKRSLPALVSLALPEEQAKMVVELVGLFVTPNSFYSEELTEVRRQQARDAIMPVTRSFIKGETVVQRGQVISTANLEALNALGLLTSPDAWLSMINVSIISLLALGFGVLYLRQYTTVLGNLRRAIFLAFLYLLPGFSPATT